MGMTTAGQWYRGAGSPGEEMDMGMVNSCCSIIRMDMRIAVRYIKASSPAHSMGMSKIKSGFIIKVVNVRFFHYIELNSFPWKFNPALV